MNRAFFNALVHSALQGQAITIRLRMFLKIVKHIRHFTSDCFSIACITRALRAGENVSEK
jgi:hypothetical protein